VQGQKVCVQLGRKAAGCRQKVGEEGSIGMCIGREQAEGQVGSGHPRCGVKGGSV